MLTSIVILLTGIIPHIQLDILIWASPPCNTFSQMRDCRIGRHGYTRETLQSERDKIGLPSLRKT